MRIRFILMFLTTVFMSVCIAPSTSLFGADWVRFRGNDGTASTDEELNTTSWGEAEKNIAWKTELPGAGSSSPIVIGNRVYLTCYSGYGESAQNPGTESSLARHLVCMDRSDGSVIWKASIENETREDRYQGFLMEHGYATSTPTSDGENIYCFFGKSGVVAFDREGKKVWQTSVGTESGSRRWGSAPSPLLYKNMVIVNASDESQTIFALNKDTGEVVWKAEAAGLENAFNTPILVKTADTTELIVAVPFELWALDADTGKLKWYAEAPLDNNVSPSVIHQDGVIYAIGGRSGGSIAIKAGGKGDVTQSHVLWTQSHSSYVPSPVIHEVHLYWVTDRGIAHCVNAKNGDLVYQERVTGLTGGGGRSFYASVVRTNNKLLAVSRSGATVIIKPGTKYEQIGVNQIAGDDSMFNATPAISDGQILIRSDRFLYCIGTRNQ